MCLVASHAWYLLHPVLNARSYPRLNSTDTTTSSASQSALHISPPPPHVIGSPQPQTRPTVLSQHSPQHLQLAIMSYRTHGLEHDPLSPGAPSPYTPDPDRYFFPSDVSTPGMQEHSNPDSDNLRPQLEHIRYASSSSQQPMLRNQAPYDKSVYKRTFSNLSKRTPEMMRRWSIGIHWYVPTSMVLVFLLGCAGALAHHLFYLHLDDKPAVNQLMMIRYGTGLAFFTKATLVGSVVLSYRYICVRGLVVGSVQS